MRVLLVDDSKTMRGIQKSVLKQLGYTEIEEACDGTDALSKVGVFKPDLLLVDWNMPNMDGLGFVKRFRANNKDTPVIIVTTETERDRVVDAAKAGVNDFIVKPFTPDLLSERISAVMSKRAA